MAGVLVAGSFSVNVKAQHIPPPPPPKIAPPEISTDDGVKAFLKRNAGVKKVQWRKKDEIILALKNGKTETFDLTQEAVKKAFETKYGTAPAAPPPPPKPVLPSPVQH